MAESLGTSDPSRALFDLLGVVGAPRSLRELGFGEDQIDKATDLALANPCWRPVDDQQEARAAALSNPFQLCRWDFVLMREGVSEAAA